MWSEIETNLLIREYAKSDKNKNSLEVLFPNKKYSTIIAHANSLGLRKNWDADKLDILLDNSNMSWYWLGFILADGHLSKNQLKLSVSEKDKSHLLSFCDYIKYDISKIRKFTNNNGFGSGNEHYKIHIGSKEVIEKIRKLLRIPDGVTNKTYNPPSLTLLSSISHQSFFSLFCGYIDGDGCIYKNACLFTIHTSWKSFLLECINLANLYTSSKDTTKYVGRYNKDGSFCIRIKTGLTRNIYTQIKPINLPLMNRKWKSLEEDGDD